MNIKFLQQLIDDDDGQTEYGAILALVALLIVVVFSFANGTLAFALSQ